MNFHEVKEWADGHLGVSSLIRRSRLRKHRKKISPAPRKKKKRKGSGA